MHLALLLLASLPCDDVQSSYQKSGCCVSPATSQVVDLQLASPAGHYDSWILNSKHHAVSALAALAGIDTPPQITSEGVESATPFSASIGGVKTFAYPFVPGTTVTLDPFNGTISNPGFGQVANVFHVTVKDGKYHVFSELVPTSFLTAAEPGIVGTAYGVNRVLFLAVVEADFSEAVFPCVHFAEFVVDVGLALAHLSRRLSYWYACGTYAGTGYELAFPSCADNGDAAAQFGITTSDTALVLTDLTRYSTFTAIWMPTLQASR